MSITTLEDRYFTRMGDALGDKSRLLQWVRRGHVIDVGAGGGELSAHLAAGGHTVTAIDSHPDSLRRLAQLPGVEAVDGTFGHHIPQCPLADTVIASSVLHEVYSYGRGLSSVTAAVQQAHQLLRPGGRFIIRDGVKPVHPESPARFRTPDPDLVEEYLRLTPHPELALARDGDWFYGTRHAVSEALLTVTWGRVSLHREAQERYELATLEGYPALVEPHGFALVHRESYAQLGYGKALATYQIESFGNPWFPPTNAIWVFDRV